jgi:cytoskeletal protein CcmA (bactofilin family)
LTEIDDIRFAAYRQPRKSGSARSWFIGLAFRHAASVSERSVVAFGVQSGACASFAARHAAYWSEADSMVQARWWRRAGTETRVKMPRRSRKQAGEIFLGPETMLSGELKSCDTLIVEGTVDSSRIECRKFILGSAGSCKGEVQAESAVISGCFDGRLIVRARLLIKSGGQVRGSVQYGHVEIEPGGELQGDMTVHPASKPAPQDELDILDIPARPSARPDKPSFAVPNGKDDRALELLPD